MHMPYLVIVNKLIQPLCNLKYALPRRLITLVLEEL